MSKELGKIPPQAVELEEVILGAIMLEKNGAFIGCKLMDWRYFYKESHALIFKACSELQSSGAPIDILTVVNKLRQDGKLEQVGGYMTVSSLTNNVASSANIEFHCRIVIQKYVGRQLIKVSSEAVQAAYDDNTDCFESIDKTINQLAKISKGLLGANSKELEDILKELTEQVENNQTGALPGIPTGVIKYDKATGGQQNGNLIIYAGRPGMGKSARLCNEVYFQLKKGYKVIIHSIEMPEIEIVARIIALHINVPPAKILKGKFDAIDEYREGTKWLSKQSLKIFSTNKLSSIILESSMHQAMSGCDIIYIDYLQIIKTEYSNPTQNVSEASKELKQLAKAMNVPVVALAQLSRSVETRGGDKIPILSDLKESGQIEQDADVVEFIYRPEYYQITQDESGNDLRCQTHYINAKCRNGTPGITTVMKWEGEMNRLSNYNSYSQHQPPPMTTNDDFDSEGDKNEPFF